ncbi:MAG: molecular chaperone DnaJ [Myxococcaceae bacterium]
MQGAWRHFESGDTVLARREAKKILASPPTEADAAQARELLARTQIPRLAFLIAVVVAFLATMLVLIARTRV